MHVSFLKYWVVVFPELGIRINVAFSIIFRLNRY